MENGGVLPDNVYLLEPTDQVIELQTILMDRETDHSDFVFYADRLMRLVIEEGLNRLPYTNVTVETPTGYVYEGIAFARGNCGVSISRSGEAMEHALRQCCRSIRIGKMLLAEDTRLLYARLMPDIAQRRVLLLYPLLSAYSSE
uniref:Uracil phosphoribosyltransferase n=1 Tax=Ascaris suum TaxID=6253 RepID=F1L887_ASCSU